MAKDTVAMIIRTRIFLLCDGKYQNLSELAKAMELSTSQLYRVREGKRGINQKFIIGAKKAFPSYKLDDLFFLDPEPRPHSMGTAVHRDYRGAIR